MTKIFLAAIICQIRPLFEQHGNVVEVALIKDRKTGQQQGSYVFSKNNAVTVHLYDFFLTSFGR